MTTLNVNSNTIKSPKDLLDCLDAPQKSIRNHLKWGVTWAKPAKNYLLNKTRIIKTGAAAFQQFIVGGYARDQLSIGARVSDLADAATAKISARLLKPLTSAERAARYFAARRKERRKGHMIFTATHFQLAWAHLGDANFFLATQHLKKAYRDYQKTRAAAQRNQDWNGTDKAREALNGEPPLHTSILRIPVAPTPAQKPAAPATLSAPPAPAPATIEQKNVFQSWLAGENTSIDVGEDFLELEEGKLKHLKILTIQRTVQRGGKDVLQTINITYASNTILGSEKAPTVEFLENGKAVEQLTGAENTLTKDDQLLTQLTDNKIYFEAKTLKSGRRSLLFKQGRKGESFRLDISKTGRGRKITSKPAKGLLNLPAIAAAKGQRSIAA